MVGWGGAIVCVAERMFTLNYCNNLCRLNRGSSGRRCTDARANTSLCDSAPALPPAPRLRFGPAVLDDDILKRACGRDHEWPKQRKTCTTEWRTGALVTLARFWRLQPAFLPRACHPVEVLQWCHQPTITRLRVAAWDLNCKCMR